MSKRTAIAALLSIALAVGAPLVAAFLNAQKFEDYPSIRVDIEPYDPRDLFYGHYMQFQISWNFIKAHPAEEAQNYNEQNRCLCVRKEDVNPQVFVTACPPKGEVLPDCRYTLRGKSWSNDQFDNGVYRYYVDEKIALPLEKLFVEENKKFSLDLHITPDGKSLPGMLYVDGLPLKDFISKNGGAIPEAEKQTLP